MRMTRMFPPTLRDDPSGAEAISHRLLLRAGFITQVSSGVYALQYMGLRVLEKVRRIVREEMNAIGCLEIDMPILQPQELWEESHRWTPYELKDEMFQTEIRPKKKDGLAPTAEDEEESGPVKKYALAPTAEEVVTFLARTYLKSYRQLPLTLYQFKTKFRKEKRARFGMVRTREFEMKDAYSFDIGEEGMRRSYQAQRDAYGRAFRRMGFDPLLSVDADSGAIGGQGSAEFMALTDDGEDTLIVCRECNYGANQEKAVSRISANDGAVMRLMRKEYTPEVKSIGDLQGFFPEISAQEMAKTIIYAADEKPVAVVIRGDRNVNEVKLRNKTGAVILGLADDETILSVTGAPKGFAGPIGLQEGTPIYFDRSVQGLRNFLCGCNEENYHLLDVNFGENVPEPTEYHDLDSACAGDGCPQCEEGVLEEAHGIELGHVFMLQQRYSKDSEMGLKVLNEEGLATTVWMGCYGIGTTRCVQAIVEQPAWRDENGIIWPRSLAPFEVVIVATDYKDEAIRAVSDELHDGLASAGIEVVLDDRPDRFGVKVTDADLIGYPVKVIVGRGARDGVVELVDRKTKVKRVVPVGDVRQTVLEWRKEVK